MRNIPTAILAQILENGDAVPISALPKSTKGQTMIDPEVARLRRLRGEALRVREIARALSSTQWAKNDPLLSRGACASWRIARVVSGKLKAHPYLRYQKGVGVGSLLHNRVLGAYLALVRKNRLQGLKEYEAQLQGLARRLDDARALTWSTDFSDSLGRSQAEIRLLIQALAPETKTVSVPERSPIRGTAHTDSLVGDLAPSIEGDWPYLAF
jgi:hypothetical protein